MVETRIRMTIIYDNGVELSIEGSERDVDGFELPESLNDEEMKAVVSYTKKIGYQFKND